MKMLPVQLSLNPPLGLWSDVLWRCPPAPPSQLAELKTQLPPSLPSDPRLWGREDVMVFLRFCEREFDLPKVDYELFQMNGKALCLLTRADFGHRCPGAGDVLHNVLQMLIIESHMMQWHLPNSPVTPTSRYPLSPHSHPPTPTWPPIGAPQDSPFHSAGAAAHMHHFMAPNSVTLSPPPSVDSQASSPPQGGQQDQQQQQQNAGSSHMAGGSSSSGASSSSSSSGSSSSLTIGGGGAGHFGSSAAAAACSSRSSNHSDSEEESASGGGSNYTDAAVAHAAAANSLAAAAAAHSNAMAAAVKREFAAAAAQQQQYSSASPPTTPILKDMPQALSQQLTNSFVNSWSQQNQQQQHQQQQQQQQHAQAVALAGGGGHKSHQPGSGGSVSAPTTPSYMQPVKREFFPAKREFFPENAEPNTNGRLLWDFLQQLLNDRNQKYSDLIAWKCRDTGVFKIVDPAGLAKLWGIQKNHLSMNYDKMSRALRYYYRVNILRKVQGERHCYQFLRNPTELKNIKNISLLRQTTPNAVQQQQQQATSNNGVGQQSSTNVNNQSHAHSHAVHSSSHTSHPHPLSPSANANGTNWPPPPQSPQRPSSRNGGGLSSAISTSAAAAAVAAAAAAAYGPPPTSPLFMHAINGAFHYLSSAAAGAGPPPNSPAANLPSLPSTPSGKFQFSALKLEHPSVTGSSNCNGQENGGEEMKPTDLSVAGSYSSPAINNGNDDCYPLIRNADGLTTIKLIRYNNDNEPPKTPCTPNSVSDHSALEAAINSGAAAEEPVTPMDSSDGNSSEETNGDQFASIMPTDLRK